LPEVHIYDALRSPRGRGKSDGALHEVTPVQLLTQVLAAVPARNSIDPGALDDVVMGCVSAVAEQGAVIPRIAALNAGFPDSVAGVQVNRFCGSGLEAVNLAAAKIHCGEADLIIAGGVESMSRVPMGSDGGAWPMDPQTAFATYFIPQGVSADLIATLHGYSRNDVDQYAVESHRRAARAWSEQRFTKSIVPIHDVLGETLLDHDEHVRPQTSAQTLGKLQPSFKEIGEHTPGFDAVAILKFPSLDRINHVHHAGNSSGIVDGAAAVLLGSPQMGHRLGLRPRARIRAMAAVGSDPTLMLTGPEVATRKVLKRAGMSVSDIDLWELNEAFAAVVLRFMDTMGVHHDAINVNGGAIAMGHPLGATGAMILGTLVDELERADRQVGLVTLCIGAGMGIATIIERAR